MIAKLSKGVTVPIDLKLWTKPNGERAHQVWWHFVPDKEYALPEGDDLFIQDLRKQEVKKRYTPELEAKLKAMGLEVKVELCPTCGGKKKFIKYPTVEIYND